jgi:hypothetical protein
MALDWRRKAKDGYGWGKGKPRGARASAVAIPSYARPEGSPHFWAGNRSDFSGLDGNDR